MCRQSVLGGKLNRLWDRYILGVNCQRAGTVQHLKLPRTQIESDNRGRFRRRARAKDGLSRARAQTPDVGVWSLDRIEPSRCRVEAEQMPDAVLSVGTDDVVGRGKRISGYIEDPLRSAEFGLHRAQRFDSPLAPVVEVPPTRAIGDKMQNAIRRPLRLEDGFIYTSSYTLSATQRAIGPALADPQFGAIPRHVGMVPGEPSQ